MKKALLVVAFVLAIVSSSNAGLVGFQLVDGSLVLPGQTVTISLISDQACNGWFIDGVAEVDAAGNQVSLGGAVTNLQSSPLAAFTYDGFLDNYNGALFSVTSGAFFGALPAGETILSFDYTISNSWNGSAITIAPLQAGKIYTWAPGEYYSVDASQANIGILGDTPIQGLTMIPEPMTISILGLGGLFLRKRK